MIVNRLYAGDTLNFGVNVADYPPADGWTLKMRYTPRFAAPVMAPVTLVALTGPVDVDGALYDYAIQASPTVTADWVPGHYGWASWVERSGARQVLQGTQFQGELHVLPDPASIAQGTDTRSSAQQALDQCDDALANASARSANASTSGVPVEYRIADRMMKYETATDAHAALLTLRGHWQRKVNQEIRRSVIETTGVDPYRVTARF
jgi:hypothetical protein